MCTPSCLPAPPAHFTQRRSFCKARADHQASRAGALGGGGVRARGPGVAGGGPGPAAVAGVAARSGAGAAVAKLGVEDGYGRRREREAWWGSWGEGEVDMGERWRAWWRLGERERRERGPGRSWWRLGEPERCDRVVEARWRCGECGRRGWVCRAGGEQQRRRFGGPGLVAPVRPVRRCRRVLGGLAWCRLVLGGRGEVSRPPGIRHAVAAAAGGMGRATVPGGVWLGGPLRRGRGGRGDTVPGTGGVAPGGRWGIAVERLVAAIPYAGAARARGVVARWGRVVGSGSCGGGVGGGGGGAAGGGGAGSCGDGAAGMTLGPLVDISVPLVGVGGRASCAVPGIVLFGGQLGRVGGRA